MSRINYNEILPKKYIVLDGDPYEVLSAQITKKQRQKPSNQTRIKNLRTGKVTEKTFHQSDSVEEAELEKQEIKYLYQNKGERWFCSKDNPSNRFPLPEESIQGAIFLKENEIIEALVFKEKITNVALPIKVNLRVVEAPPSIKGNTAQGGSKQVVLESGASVSTPLFIQEGDIIRVNTETGEYSERVESVRS